MKYLGTLIGVVVGTAAILVILAVVGTGTLPPATGTALIMGGAFFILPLCIAVGTAIGRNLSD